MRSYHPVYIISAIANRILSAWRKKEFEKYTGEKTRGLKIMGRIYLYNPNVHVGRNVTIYPGVMFQGSGSIYIGDNTFIENNTMFYSEKGYEIKIGDNCMIAGMCYLINTDHEVKLGKLMNKQGTISGNIIVEDDCWIAGNATILKGSHIKQGCIIAAKALLKGKTEANGIYGGIPAKLIKYRE